MAIENKQTERKYDILRLTLIAVRVVFFVLTVMLLLDMNYADNEQRESNTIKIKGYNKKLDRKTLDEDDAQVFP